MVPEERVQVPLDTPDGMRYKGEVMKKLSNVNGIIKAAFKEGYYLSGGELHKPDGTPVKQYMGTNGYYKVSLGGRTSSLPDFNRSAIPFHKLVAYKKFGNKLFKADCVRHLDGNCLNNDPDNLDLGTTLQNIMDRSPEDRQKHAQKAANAQKKLTKDQIASLLKDREGGMKYKDLCAKYGIAKSTVSYIVNGKTYKTA